MFELPLKLKQFILLTIVFSAIFVQSCKKDIKKEPVLIPEITSINPSEAKAGDEALISGKNFGGNPAVFFANAQARIISKTSVEIKVAVPSGTGNVQVYIQNGSTKSNTLTFTFLEDVQQTPVLTSVTFNAAIAGDTLVILGTNFDTNSKALFGATEAPLVSRTPNTLTVIIPPGSGAVKLTVQNNYNGSIKVSNQINFLYTQIPNNNYGSLNIGGVQYKLDTLSFFEIAPGTFYLALNLTEGSGAKPIKAFITTVDGANPYMSFKPVVGRDSVSNNERPSAMAARKSAPGKRYVIGTNSDFWEVTNGTGYQRNVNMIDGVLASRGDNRPIAGNNYAGNAIFDAKNTMYIDNLVYNASVRFGSGTMTIDSMNYYKYVNTNNLTFFNIYCGKTTGTDNARTEVAITPVNGKWNYLGETDVKVKEVFVGRGNNPVQDDISILSGATGAAADFLNQLKKDDVLKLNFSLVSKSGLNIVPHNIAGGRQIIMHNGSVMPNIWNGDEKHPRTGIGYSHNGTKVYFCVIDGRSSASVGVYTSEMAEIMKYFGATDALNFDGGGSSSMFIDKLGTVNKPSDGNERAVVSGMFAVSSAPDDNDVVKIVSQQYIVRLKKGGSFTPAFCGLNKYGQIVNANVTGVTLHTNGLGSYANGIFVSGTQAGFGYITAKLGHLSTRIKIFID